MWSRLIAAAIAIGAVQGAAIDRDVVNTARSIQLDARADPSAEICNVQNTAPFYFIGGEGDAHFCRTKWPGAVLLKTLTTWSHDSDIIGMQLDYTNGFSETVGVGFNNPNSGSITFAAGELVTSAWLVGNGIGTRTGKIHIETNKGQKVDLGTSTAQGGPYSPNLGSGLLVGVTGATISPKSGTGIAQTALVFVGSKITDVAIGNVDIHFPDKPNQLTSPGADQVHFYNGATTNGTYTFTTSFKKTKSATYSQSTTGTFGMDFKVEFEAGIPLIEKTKAELGVHWEVSHETTSSETWTDEYNPSWNQAGALLPHQGMKCKGTVFEGSGQFDYDSKVTLSFADGSKYSYNEPGKVDVKQYVDGESSCVPDNNAAVPPGYTKGKVTYA